jgi:stage II sporulation protein D
MTQSAAIFGPASDIKPLAGGVSCDFCRIAPGDTYRWGPLQVSAREVLEKLVARYPELGSLEPLTEIDAVEEAPNGRIIHLRLTGSSGQTHEILAERFRVAVGPDLMKSTDCKIRLIRGEVVFSRGRGYGHGLGLCQWGMQGQALAGKRAGEILRYYYPGAELTRVY